MGIKIQTLKEKVYRKTRSVKKPKNASISNLCNNTQSISRCTPVWWSTTLPPCEASPIDRVCTVQDRVHHPVGHRVQRDRDRGVHHSVQERVRGAVQDRVRAIHRD